MRFVSYLAICATLLLSACGTTDTSNKNSTEGTQAHVGEYVSEGYEQRADGYDWVAVSVSAHETEDTLAIKVHSREDIKKPTCSLETTATAQDAGRYVADVDGTSIVFEFKDNTVSISAGHDTEAHALMYFCSGGGSLIGDYTLLEN